MKNIDKYEIMAVSQVLIALVKYPIPHISNGNKKVIVIQNHNLWKNFIFLGVSFSCIHNYMCKDVLCQQYLQQKATSFDSLLLCTDPYTMETRSVSQSIVGESNEVIYSYMHGLLTGISSGDTGFKYSYDGFGNKKSIDDLNNNNLVAFDFKTQNGKDISKAIYSNGWGYETETNALGQVEKVYLLRNGAKSLVTREWSDFVIFILNCPSIYGFYF